jgi:aminocarboxymuconate-semialdehyde decarboxylase
MTSVARRVDFHTHVIPRSMPGGPYAGCPELHIDENGRGNVTRDGKPYRVVDERVWDVERRLRDMDAQEIDLQVLSPMPVYYGYEAPAVAGAAFARAQNEHIATIVRERPARFAGLGTVVLQDVERACAELDYLMQTLGLTGVEIGTHADARDLDDPLLEPFWSRCAALDALVFVHPESAPGFDRVARMRLIVSTGYPSETGITAAKLLMGGIFLRHPALRIVLAHGGGTLPWLLPRLDRLWTTMPDVREALPVAPSAAARAFYCDTLTFDARNLELVAERIGASHLVVGSDYPFTVMEDPPGSVLDAAHSFDKEDEMAMRGGNAARLLAREPRVRAEAPA